MIERYTRQEMGKIWSPENRWGYLLQVEIAVAEAQAELKIIPPDAAVDIKKKSKFSIDRIAELEKATKHDVLAFVKNVAENVGNPNGRFVHFSLTSSDVLDTALSLQVKDAGKVLFKSLEQLIASLKIKAQEHAQTLCVGRTHGIHAEPTTFGMKIAGHFCEFERNLERLKRALKEMSICKLSGAVGTYSAQSVQVEKKVSEKLDLIPEKVATQVIPRDRHAELIWVLAMIGGSLERLAVELRHLQRTEVNEVIEGFTPGQMGSSAMPHKKNPISAENITGAARMLRAYAMASLENIALWHERDISHSSVERIAFPDAFILCDYAVDRMNQLISGLYVNQKQMLENVNLTGGMIMSSHLLIALVEKGMDRDEAYKLIQELSHQQDEKKLLDKVFLDQRILNLLSKNEIEDIFSGKKHLTSIANNFKRIGLT